MKKARLNAFLFILTFILLGGFLIHDGWKKEPMEVLAGILMFLLAVMRYFSVYKVLKDAEEDQIEND